MQLIHSFIIPIQANVRAGPGMSGPDRACPGRAGRPGSIEIAGRESLISPGVAVRGTWVGDPPRPCQPCRLEQPSVAGPAIAADARPFCLCFASCKSRQRCLRPSWNILVCPPAVDDPEPTPKTPSLLVFFALSGCAMKSTFYACITDLPGSLSRNCLQRFAAFKFESVREKPEPRRRQLLLRST